MVKILTPFFLTEHLEADCSTMLKLYSEAVRGELGRTQQQCRWWVVRTKSSLSEPRAALSRVYPGRRVRGIAVPMAAATPRGPMPDGDPCPRCLPDRECCSTPEMSAPFSHHQFLLVLFCCKAAALPRAPQVCSSDQGSLPHCKLPNHPGAFNAKAGSNIFMVFMDYVMFLEVVEFLLMRISLELPKSLNVQHNML